MPRVQDDWVAQRVDFDVEQLGLPKGVTESVVWLATDGRHVRLRLSDAGGLRPMTTGRQTRYEIDGRVQDVSAPPAKGQVLQGLVLWGDLLWVAMDVDVGSAW